MEVAGKLESKNTYFAGSKDNSNRQLLRARIKSWLGSWPEWGIIILLFLALEVAVRSIEQAQWITPQPSLTVVLILAVGIGWLLGKSRLPGRVIHPLGVVIGAAVTVWQASSLLPQSVIASRVNQLAVALQSWWQAMSMAEPSEGTIHFAVFLIFATWVIGYISTWYILQRQNAWVAVSLGAITILINLDNLPQQHYTFFFFYVLAALFLVGMTSLAKHHYWFKKHDINYPRRGIFYFVTSLLCLSILAVSTAWLTPEVRVERLETLVSTKTMWSKNIEKHFNNLLAAVPAKQSFLKSGEQGELLFGDSYGQGDELQFVVISDRPYYLRSRMYNVYTSSGWTSSNSTAHILRQGISSPKDDEISQRSEVTYTVLTRLRTDVLLTAGEFISSDIPVLLLSLALPNYNIDLLHSTNDGSLPPDVASLAHSLRRAQVADKEISPDELRQLLPEDLALAGVGAARYNSEEADDTVEPISDQLTTIEVTRIYPERKNVVAIATPRLLRSDQRYTVTTSISSATPAELSGTEGNYPYWVTDYYLQLPPTLPERVRQLSEIVTREAESPYDQALAIKQYLSQLAYTLEVKAPPQGADGVDHFLFTQQSGNCVQFASAMAVMLRSVGVPSRVLVGYAPGEWDTATGSSTLRAKNRHAWTEVYFPGYGWVEFEASPAIDSEIRTILTGGSGISDWGWWLEEEEGEFDALVETLRWVKGLNPKERREWLERIGWEEEELAEWLDWLETLGLLELPAAAGADETLDAGSVATTPRNRLGSILFFAITAAILLVYILWSVLSRRSRPFMRPDYATKIYRKMCRLASLVGLGPKPQQTPWEHRARLTSVFPLQVEAIDCIVQTYVESRFSRRKELDIWQRGSLRKSWNRVYPVLLKRLFHIRY